MSVGYTTLYGDLAGGFAVIKDVPKTLVYRLCAWRNSAAGAAAGTIAGAGRPIEAPIPPSIIERAPSAELRPDQRDEDSLPPYELLDRILQGYIEHDHSREQLIAAGPARSRRRPHDPARRPRRVQAPPGAARASRSPRARSAATAACRSPTAIAASSRAAAAAPRGPTLRPCASLAIALALLCAARARRLRATRCRTSRSRTARSRA